MTTDEEFEILLVGPPGLEAALADEAREHGFADPQAIAGGVVIRGGWPAVWRANLVLRGASRVLARIAQFRAMHLAQLDKRARRVPWADFLRPDVPFRVEASCTRSRIYHKGAAAQRIARAITETVGAPELRRDTRPRSPDGAPAQSGASAADTASPDYAALHPGYEDSADPAIRVLARIDDDLCTISLDSSGESLHKRGHKQAVAKAPLRETLAALILRQCGYTGAEPVVDPMCGAGTFVIEAAEIAAGLAPGRSRSFAFERLATFDAMAWKRMRSAGARSPDGAPAKSGVAPVPPAPSDPGLRSAPSGLRGVHFYGSDRDAGAIAMARANAERAGVAHLTDFRQHAVSDLARPDGPPGLVIVNPPYGTRVGKAQDLAPLYRALGQTLRDRFAGWRVGLVTSDPALARATGLPFGPPGPPVPHGGLKVKLYRTGVLG